MSQKDVTGFVADFPEGLVEKKLEKLGVNIPANWEKDNNDFGFQVVTDMGRELELAFWDFEKDEQVGEEIFVVGYDDVNCWA